jgi:hypothetical protein
MSVQIKKIVHCNRCDEHTELETDKSPAKWVSVIISRDPTEEVDFCPSCAASFDHWADTFRTKKRATDALQAAVTPVKVEGYGEIFPEVEPL